MHVLYRFSVQILSLSCAVSLYAAETQLSTTEGALAANRKIQCSLKDEVPALCTWDGDAFSRRVGERDQYVKVGRLGSHV